MDYRVLKVKDYADERTTFSCEVTEKSHKNMSKIAWKM